MTTSGLARTLFALALLVGAFAHTDDAQAVGFREIEKGLLTRFRDTMKRQFPDVFVRQMAEYGWRIRKDDRWVPDLPRHLGAKAVILVHGLDEPGALWMCAAPALTEAGYTVLEFRYPNDQPVRDSAAFLLASLDALRERGVEEVAVVAHSMGGLVTREALTNPDLAYDRWSQDGAIPAVRMLIMAGTPNQGSKLAHLRVFSEMRDQWLRFVSGRGHLLSGLTDGAGEARVDLLPGSEFLIGLNVRPHPPGVRMVSIAGIASPLDKKTLDDTIGEWERSAAPAFRKSLATLHRDLSELTAGIGDGAVSLESTRLKGVEDHVTVPGNHLSMIRNVLKSSERVPPAIPVIQKRLAELGWVNQASLDQ